MEEDVESELELETDRVDDDDSDDSLDEDSLDTDVRVVELLSPWELDELTDVDEELVTDAAVDELLNELVSDARVEDELLLSCATVDAELDELVTWAAVELELLEVTPAIVLLLDEDRLEELVTEATVELDELDEEKLEALSVELELVTDWAVDELDEEELCELGLETLVEELELVSDWAVDGELVLDDELEVRLTAVDGLDVDELDEEVTD